MTHIYDTKAIDRNRYTLNFGVIDMYEGEDGQEQEYCGIIENIIKLDFWRFDLFLLDVKWFKHVMG
jgi:hypothetical protein